MICQYGMLFQLSLTESEPYSTRCLYAHIQATDAQMTLCKGITFSDYLHIQITILDGHTGINLGVWYRWVAAHVF